MITTKSENIREVSVTVPFPEKPAVFEHVDYNVSDLVKTTNRFYENEIIGFQQNTFEEGIYTVKYNRLSGKIYRGKLGIEIWGWVFTIVILFISTITGFYFGFGSILGTDVSIKAWYTTTFILLALLVISLPLNLIKREVIWFYDKNGNIAYMTHVNRSNKDKIEKIIEFVQSKIPAEDKQWYVEEQP